MNPRKNSSVDGKLPQFLRELIANPPQAGEGVHIWLFKVACQLHAHLPAGEIVGLLENAVASCGRAVPKREIIAAVQNALSCAWQPARHAAPLQSDSKWPCVDTKHRAAIIGNGGGLSVLWELSTPRIVDNAAHSEQIIDRLFSGNPLLCCGVSQFHFDTKPRDDWRGRLDKLQFIVPSPMSDVTGLTKDGRESKHTLNNTGPRRFLICEFDTGTPDEHAALLLHLGTFAPLVCVVHSGGKSLHGWFFVAGQPENKVEKFFRYAVTLGADRATWTRSQFVRMPDGTRDNGSRQTVFFLNFPPWKSSMNDLLKEPGIREVPAISEKPRAPQILVEFEKPSVLASYTPPEGSCLVGDYHIQRGAPFVIGGAPGVGKSRAAVALAVAGATGKSWFGLPVHWKFRTMILQTENGRVRLKNEFSEINCPELDDYVRICAPPPFGFAFDRFEFRDQLTRAIEEFKPDVFLLDPFNRLAQDDKAKDYRQAFDDLLTVLPNGDNAPALGIVTHTRKPKPEERASGRNALNMLAGSYLLGSVPRAVFILQSASDETTESRVIWICCKNNDGELGSPTAWERKNGIFTPAENFDWSEYDAPSEQRLTITEGDLAAVFDGGKRQLAKSQAVQYLMDNTGCKQSAAYAALKRFSDRLNQGENKLLNWKI